MKVAILVDGEITTGTVFFAQVGDVATIDCHDENGLPFQATGEVVEIFE